jgi:hypothetical protein
MITPEMFNDTGDDGSGFPGLQRAVFNRFTWWLHSGNMDSGLHIAGYDITGVNLIYADNIKVTTLSELTGDIRHTQGDITGDGYHISGYKSISADTGVFQEIKGFSDINMQDSLDFANTYHLKGVSQISGSIISGLEVTGTSGLIDDLLTSKAPVSDDHVTRRQDLFWSTGTDLLLHNNTTVQGTANTAPTKLKETVIGGYIGNNTITWEYRNAIAAHNAYSQLRINGSTLGAEETNGTTSYEMVTRVLTGTTLKPGDLLQVYGRTQAGGNCQIKELKIYNSIGEDNDP